MSCLSQRQKQIYKFLVNLHRLLPAPAGTDLGVYNTVPYLAGVPCFFDATPETDNPGPVGRTKTINIFTLDKFYFPSSYTPQNSRQAVDIDVQDTDMLVMIYQPGGQTNLHGVWWGIQGNPEPQAFLLSDQFVYAKRIGIIKPPGIS